MVIGVKVVDLLADLADLAGLAGLDLVLDPVLDLVLGLRLVLGLQTRHRPRCHPRQNLHWTPGSQGRMRLGFRHHQSRLISRH